MKFSRAWVGDYVDLPESTPELAERLTAIGLNVEGLEPVGSDDTLLDVEVTANRPDCMNHLGLAREVAAAYGVPLRPPAVSIDPRVEPERTDSVAVAIDDPEGCPRYAAVVVRGVTVGESPQWLADRLEAIGVRPINNLVDVTNYVLWETGQPLHAFDLATLAEGRIVVRRGGAGEKLTTLDGEERELAEDILVIADGDRAVALAGIMGGADTEVSAETVDVLIESAHFDRGLVRAGARRLGMKTDASHRFERGADPEGCLRAALRAADLMVELAGGSVEPAVVDVRALDLPAPAGRFGLAQLDRFAGFEYEAGQVERWLSDLGFGLEAENGGWRVTVPSWRRFDFELDPQGEVYPAYFYEEAMRMGGFEPIPSTLPAVEEPDVGASAGHRLREDLRRYLSAAGLAETVTYAFYDPRHDDRFPGLDKRDEPLRLANALSEQYEWMRRSMLPNLVTGALFNQRRGAAVVRLYEIGHVFPGAGGEEVESLGLVVGGVLGSPWEGSRELDFHDLKGVVEGLAADRGLPLEFRPAAPAGMVAGTGCEVLAEGRVIGYLGRVDDPKMSYHLYAGELAVAPFATGWVPSVETPSRHPGVAVDLTLTHAVDVPWRDLAAAIEEARPVDLEDFGLKDVYDGEGVPAGAANSTLFFRYVSAERSLTQDEVNERHQALTARLAERFGWKR